MKGLTPKQYKVLDYIHSFIEQYHYSPSYREIMQHFSFASPGSVYKYICLLKKKGLLNKDKHAHRSIKPIDHKLPTVNLPTTVQVPLIGNISESSSLELFPQHQTFEIPPLMVPNPENTYILKVQGDTLKEDSILNGDFLLIETRQEIQPGEIILGTINQQGTVLKRYFPEGQTIRLESQHSFNHPLNIRSDHLLIHGVLIGVLRLF